MPVMSGPYLRPRRRRPTGYISYDIETRGPEPIGICIYGPAPGREETDNSLPFIGGTMKRKINKFYVGAQHIAQAIEDGHNDSHTHPTIDGAIEQARKRVEQGEDTVVVVKIVAIVKRKEQPVVVEIIK